MSPARDELTHIHNKLGRLTNCMSKKKKSYRDYADPEIPSHPRRLLKLVKWTSEVYGVRVLVYCGTCLFFIPVDYLKLFYPCK